MFPHFGAFLAGARKSSWAWSAQRAQKGSAHSSAGKVHGVCADENDMWRVPTELYGESANNENVIMSFVCRCDMSREYIFVGLRTASCNSVQR